MEMNNQTEREFDGMSMNREEIANALAKKVKGELAKGALTEEIALDSYDMGMEYAKTKKFSSSSRYKNYDYELDDGSFVPASSYFRIFTTRFQTPAYMDAEKYLKEFFDDSDQFIFHLVRDKRLGINGVFRAVISSREIQKMSFTDYVLVISCFGAGLMHGRNRG